MTEMASGWSESVGSLQIHNFSNCLLASWLLVHFIMCRILVSKLLNGCVWRRKGLLLRGNCASHLKLQIPK